MCCGFQQRLVEGNQVQVFISFLAWQAWIASRIIKKVQFCDRRQEAAERGRLGHLHPGVLGEEKSLTHESFTSKLLDFPQYTRPAEFRGMSVPEILLSGDHAKIEKWRHARQVEKTRLVRPDLLT